MTAPTAASRPYLLIALLAPVTGLLGVAAVSTVVPLSPYRPLGLRAEVPCLALTAGGEVLRTLPPDVDATLGSGLVMASAGGRVTVDSSGRRLLDRPLATGCTYVIESDAAGTRVLLDDAVVADAAGLLPPQVAELATSAAGASGLAVEIHTDARYRSAPTPLKTALLVAHGLALLALLVVAWRVWPGRGPGAAATPTGPGRRRGPGRGRSRGRCSGPSTSTTPGTR